MSIPPPDLPPPSGAMRRSVSPGGGWGRSLGEADWGRILGILGLSFVFVLLCEIFLPAPSRLPQAKQSMCRTNQGHIVGACLEYAKDHDGHFPATLEEAEEIIVAHDPFFPSDDFTCPALGGVRAMSSSTRPALGKLAAGGLSSYVYLGKGMTTAVAGTTIILYEPLTNHYGRGMNVTYADATSQWLDARVAAKVMAELQAGHNPPRPEKVN